MANWFIWGAIIGVIMALSDVSSEIRLLREDLVRLVRWYMEDDGK